jgi:opacity protein-like surface antigen
MFALSHPPLEEPHVSPMRFALVNALFAAIAAPALAADLPTLPSTAASQPTEPDWKGFYIGSGVSFSAIRGAKGQVGGDIFAGYDHVYSNGVVLGLQFDTGYDPWVLSKNMKGFDFATTSVKLGYEMGRFTPYVTTGVGLAKATNFGAGLPNANNSVNGLFSEPGAVQAVGQVGVGLDYAVTNNLHVGVEAFVVNGGGGGGALAH